MTLDCTNINLRKGCNGEPVKTVQNYLAYLGLYTRQIDGDYGNYTVTGVKKLQGNYGLTQDGWFGPKTCKGCGINGQDISNSNQTIELSLFKEMSSRRDQFISENGREPDICYVDYETKYRYITNSKFKDMKTRYDNFITTNGREPNYCYVNIPSESSGTEDTGDYVSQFSDAIGKNISNFKQGYEGIKYRGYSGYNNDVYDRATALKRLKKKSGLNCSDISQLLHKLASCYGHDVHYIHIRCKSGIGHVIISVDGTWVDGAAALSSGKSYGSGWCFNGTVINKDDSWLMSDDGKT